MYNFEATKHDISCKQNKNTIARMEYQHRSYQGVLFDVYFYNSSLLKISGSNGDFSRARLQIIQDLNCCVDLEICSLYRNSIFGCREMKGRFRS